MGFFWKRGEKRCVSPVVGILLLFVITAFLTATIVALSIGVSDTLREEAQAGVSIESDDQALTVSIVTLGSTDYISLTGEPYDHLDSNDLEKSDFREIRTTGEIRIEKDDIESEGHVGRLTVIGISGRSESVITREDYEFEE